MKKSTQDFGAAGEKAASRYLAHNEYIVLEHNYRYRRSQIDIIAMKDDTLVFVEVKYRTSSSFGFPEQMVSLNQFIKICEAAEYYVESVGWRGEIRFDIIAILGTDPQRVEHFEDIFIQDP